MKLLNLNDCGISLIFFDTTFRHLTLQREAQRAIKHPFVRQYIKGIQDEISKANNRHT